MKLLIALLTLLVAPGCVRNCIYLTADDTARMLQSGEYAAGKKLPLGPPGDAGGHYHSHGDIEHQVKDADGNYWNTIASIGERRTITLYAYNGVLFAACTLQASPQDRQYTQEGSRETWHFCDPELMRRHIEAAIMHDRNSPPPPSVKK